MSKQLHHGKTELIVQDFSSICDCFCKAFVVLIASIGALFSRDCFCEASVVLIASVGTLVVNVNCYYLFLLC